MDTQPTFAIDLLKTFTQHLSDDEKPTFFMIDGMESHPSIAFWDLGKKAFSAITIDNPDLDEDENIQEPANLGLRNWIKILEEFRGFLLEGMSREEGFKLVHHETGDAVPIACIKNLTIEGLSRNFANWHITGSHPSRELKHTYKQHFALLTLYAMNDLRFGDAAFSDSPSWAVGTYENARDMWDLATYFDSALESIQSLTRKAAIARHRENRELKQEALNYYAENKSRFKSRAAAAAEINKLLPVRERTIYKWLTEADKE